MKNFRFPPRILREQRTPEPPDALIELIVGMIAAGYPSGVLQLATIHNSGRITGYFIDERLNKKFEFEIKDGFSFKPSK